MSYKILGVLFFWIVGMFTGFFCLYAQEYKFNAYGQNEGLTDVFINTINQDDNGDLVVGTGQGVGFFDGLRFVMKTKEDGLVDNYVEKSFKDSKGNIWFGHAQGGISLYRSGVFETIHPGEGISSMINGIQEDSYGNMWFSTQSFGVFYRDKNKKITFFSDKFDGRYINSLFVDENNFIYVGVDASLEIYKFIPNDDGGIISKIQSVSGIDDDVVKIIALDNGRMVVATKYAGLYLLEQKEDIFVTTKILFSNLQEELMIKDIYLNAGRLWISTYGMGVLRTILTNTNCFVSESYNGENGLGGDGNVNVTFVDREGVLWIGTSGNGLYSKDDNRFTFYFRDKVQDNYISYLAVKPTEIWTSGRGNIRCYDKQYAKIKCNYTMEENNLPNDEITCFYFVRNDSVLLVGTKKKGLYYKFKGEDKFIKFEFSDDVLANSITSITGNRNFVWLGTQNGTYKIEISSRDVKRFSMSDGLSHNAVKNIYTGRSGLIYIGTASAFLNIMEGDKIRKVPFTLDDDYISVDVTKIYEDDDKRVWVSSKGKGIFCFVGDTILHYGVKQGLLSNYCYGLAEDDKGKIWVSHDGGLSSLDTKNGEIEVFDARYGLDTRFSISAVEAYKNEVWFGSQNGVVKYDSKEAVKNSVPPITSIQTVVIDDAVLGHLSDTILPAGEHDFEFFYKGVSLKNPKGVQYKYILEGYDKSWSPFVKENSVKYTKVREGDYVFRVKSYNSDGVEGNEVSFTIHINLPFYKKWWFYPLIGLIVLAIIIFIVKYREQQHLNYLNTLSKELDLRTSELVEQKEKMEEINKDLTDSINYAQKIQRAILPEDDVVKELFPESFILFKPRDIVSGDFYWITEYFGKKVIVFADCTGHGVPGGFMSMIGRILLRETCTVKNLRDPGVILEEIDKGLVNVLKQTDDISSNKDGMDLGVVVIDSRTNILSYSGAMRPLYIYRNGKRIVLKGNRFSVGGISSRKKVFESQKFQLEKGDILYMFSDGFADQFGGRRGRKMKISVLNELLDQVCYMPFDQQKEEIDLFFETWKRDEPQMDDVLLIGIKIQ